MEDTAIHSVAVSPELRDVRPVLSVQGSLRGTETILLVDDIEMLRALTRIILEAQGYTVLEASSGDEALFIAGTFAGSIDLLLTDLRMQPMSGPELAERILSDRRTTRVLYMSGCREEAVLEQYRVSPDYGLLQKPFAPGILLCKVRKALDRAMGLPGHTKKSNHSMTL